jgi:hypothetical protein
MTRVTGGGKIKFETTPRSYNLVAQFIFRCP